MQNLLIIFGGKSGEHEVSCISAASVLTNINAEKYNITKIGITKSGEWFKTEASPEEIKTGEWVNRPKTKAFLSPDTSDKGIITISDGVALLEKIDVIFPVMHGTYCEDGCIQGLFELSGIPFVGPSVLSSAVCMDKGFAKLSFAAAEIPQADWLVVLKSEISEEIVEKIEEKFSYPIFIKPCNAGSSLGVSKVSSKDELLSALNEAAKHDNRILVEEFILGREIECSVLGNDDPKASVLGEITPSNEFYDYEAKYKSGESVLTIPANLPTYKTEKIREYAIKAYKALGCKGLSRIDFFVHKETGGIYLNEINTLPGFTHISMYPKLWESCSIPYNELIDCLISLAKTDK